MLDDGCALRSSPREPAQANRGRLSSGAQFDLISKLINATAYDLGFDEQDIPPPGF
ncbi:hypothetical protein [Anatilimnocola floriformis]|uniref:hypothetical protein n=1 Tax=Anatilimnocola floriformis TaxID=2948575 RepID=UPI0020C2A35B|nr:hypothetical protein [Anatilimnocola floriformis]